MRTRCATVAALAWILCTDARAAPGPTPGAEPWRARMDQLSGVLNALMPEMSSEERFSDPQRRARILGHVRALRELSHGMKADRTPATRDPSVGLITGLFTEDLREAEAAIKEGQSGYARSVLYAVVNDCVGCHTRTDAGAHFPSLALGPSEASLSRFERATLYAATRRYQDAFREYLAVVTDPGGPVHRGLDWDRSVQAALALSVRTLGSPEAADRLVQAVLDHAAAPVFLKQNALAWRESLRAWRAETAGPADDGALLSRATRLLDEALVAGRWRTTRGNAVLYLRATRALHDLLGRAPDGPGSQEALHLLGVAYEGLGELELYQLHPLFYEACIRRGPHSPTAMLCFERYESAMYLLYAGSGGYQPPPDVKNRLGELHHLAAVEDP